MEFNVKRSLVKSGVFIAVFFISLVVIGKIMNKGNSDMTTELSGATLPLLYTVSNDGEYNCLHGYTSEVNIALLRDHITVLNDDRSISFRMDTYGEKVDRLSFEVRDIKGQRLIENGDIDIHKSGSDITFNIAIKDLIDQDTEYNLVICVDTGKTVARYYTRFIWGSDYSLQEKLSFVKEFHRKTFDKESAKELAKYLESNSQGNNNTYGYVNIHCSLDQISWGDLQVEKIDNPEYTVVELEKQTASITADYMVEVADGEEKHQYSIHEYYRIRYTSDRVYLLDFERYMNRLFDEQAEIYVNNKIILGILGKEASLTESEDGNIFAFVIGNKLCSFNVTTNRLSILFSFCNEENNDMRSRYNNHKLRVLGIDEAGNIRFLIAGYMNRGNHEGQVGVEICYYSSTLNTIEEEIFVESDYPSEVLQKEIDTLSYVNKDEVGYVMLGGKVYRIDLNELTSELVVEDVQAGDLFVSDTQKMLAWQEEKNRSRKLSLLNLNSGNITEIAPKSGEYIKALGFMDEDFIYGYVKEEDVSTDAVGYEIFPMYGVFIQDADGKILKAYQNDEIYILDTQMKQNQITLYRAKKSESGQFVSVSDDHIMSNEEVVQGENTLSTVYMDYYKEIAQISTKSTLDPLKIKVLTPKMILFEGNREIALKETGEETSRYYVYVKGHLKEVYLNAEEAVVDANENAGVVVNENGDYIWKRGTLSTRNQIMAIKEDSVSNEKNSMAVCLDTILGFEGVTINSQFMLDQGKTFLNILEENLNVNVLNLRGCSMDAMLYYVNQDIPVMGVLSNGNAVLIVGFNEYNVVIFDPVAGTISKKGKNDSAAWFKENGNNFVTYIK